VHRVNGLGIRLTVGEGVLRPDGIITFSEQNTYAQPRPREVAGASQGAIAHAAASQQGLITEAGYNEQAASYNLMATAADQAAAAEDKAAEGAKIGAIIDFTAAAVSLIPSPSPSPSGSGVSGGKAGA
jgi:hypothetical protein